MNISRKMSVVVTACVLFVSIPSLWVYYHYSKQHLLESTLTEIQVITRDTIDNYQRFIQLASPNIKALSRLLKNELATSPEDQYTSFEQRMMQFEDGAWRNRISTFNGQEQAGLFLPSDIELTKQTKQFYITAMDVFNSFGASATSNQVLDNIWMLGHDRGELIFDLSHPDFVYVMSDSTDYLSTPWMTLASPESNPDRTIKWTPVLFDPVSESWMTSVIYPLDIDGEWRATLGIDISLNNIFSLFESKNKNYKNEHHFVLDQQGRFILAGPWQYVLEKSPDVFELGPNEQALKRRLTKTIGAGVELLEPVMFLGHEHQVIASTIEPMGWRYFRLISSEEIYQPLQNRLLKTSILILFMTMLLGLLINTAVRKFMVLPLLQMAEQARSYALGKKPLIVTISGHDEVAELNTAFQTMHNEMTRDAEQLLHSERRYRQVVTNINEAIIQIDKEHCWQFLSPVWKKLSAYDLHYSLQRSVSEFFHPAEREYITRTLDSLLEKKQISWNGEVRLKRLDQRYIWVNLSLHLNKEATGQAISGTIENNHINHLTRATNQLIRTAEKMVVTANFSVPTVLEFVTKELLDILNVPLVWVKICKGNEKQVLSHAGELSDFLFENSQTWSGLHCDGSPVITAIREHHLVRVTNDSDIPIEWRRRLKNDGIKDSLFLPFYLAEGDTHAIIGLHTYDDTIFDSDLQQVMHDFSDGLRLICQMAEDQNLMRLHRAAVEKTANAIMITDNYGTIEWVNDAFSKQTLFQPDEVIGKKPSVLNSNTEESSEYIKKMWVTIKSGEVWSGEIVNQRKDSSFISVYQTVTPLRDNVGNISHFISVSEDVTERKESQKRIAFMATHDDLTSLPNRSLLRDRLQQAIAHAKRTQSKMAVLFIDIDHFKYINDSLGHQIGDELLKILSARLISELREEDTVARFGGDEFVIVLPDISTLTDTNEVATNLLNNIKQPYFIGEHELMITGSIGISIYPSDADDADDLIQHADSAMYLAKEQGRNNCQFYTSEINERITRRLTLEKALRKAVESQQFVLHYQPKVDLMTNKITGVEALVRWQHPEMGLVSPAEFIPLAEETGVILEIGDWVMLTACQQMKDWEQDYPELKNMSINVSARQFWQNDFIERVESIFSETHVTIDKVEFELTESVVIDDVDSAIIMMDKLKQLGVYLSIDDFGTGYSSLSYLQRFPVDVLKIDRSFVMNLTPEQDDSAIIRSILALAENFNLQVVAEGIEEEYQKKILSILGCDYGQGYLFSRPVSAEELAEQLKAQYR
ncbi:MAG: EAL domain-containing protein [Methylophaga sp.]|nr:EAL domain-containing protein [Methylophaga sp.]